MLFVDPNGDGVEGDSALWVDPTLVFADGRTEPLVDRTWTSADALWDSASIRRSTSGRPLTFHGRPIAAAISTLAASRIEYALPPGVARFRATGAIDERTKAPSEGGTVRFVVSASTLGSSDTPSTTRIDVDLRQLGLSAAVRVRDLWAHRSIGTVRGTFSPEVASHGAGLYRLFADPLTSSEQAMLAG